MNTGHMQQVATFEKLVGFVHTQGTMFNPSKPSLRLTALKALLTSAKEAIEAVRIAQAGYVQAVNKRSKAFDSLPQFLTRLVNTMAAAGASEETIENAYGIVRRFSSRKRKPAFTVTEGVALEPRYQNTAQLDFDSKVNNLGLLIELIKQEPTYKPNEAELKTETLDAYFAQIKALNSAVINNQVVLSNARTTRDKALYFSTGMHGIALAIKRYIKGVYGFKSFAYNQIRGLKFVNSKM